MTTHDPLVEFLHSPRTNDWLHYGPMEVYVRKGYHVVWGEARRTFDIANVSVAECYQKQGIFTEFLSRVPAELQKLGGFEGIYIENVHNMHLREHLRGKGWTEVYTLPPSFYRAVVTTSQSFDKLG